VALLADLRQQVVMDHRLRETPTRDGDQARAAADVVTEDYRSILTELSLLTTVSVLLFGFLLTVVMRENLTGAEGWLLFIALISIASATVIFVLPVTYHRVQYPYSDWDKFQVRSHSFISAGLPFFLVGFYASIALALWERFDWFSLIVSGIPLVLGGTIFLARRRLF
jgi:hypothetical protein